MYGTLYKPNGCTGDGDTPQLAKRESPKLKPNAEPGLTSADVEEAIRRRQTGCSRPRPARGGVTRLCGGPKTAWLLRAPDPFPSAIAGHRPSALAGVSTPTKSSSSRPFRTAQTTISCLDPTPSLSCIR